MEEPARLAYIYALIDPWSGEIRYIGSSTHPRRRLQKHLAGARAHHRLRSLSRTRWNEEPVSRRMRFAYRARMQAVRERPPHSCASGGRAGWTTYFNRILTRL